MMREERFRFEMWESVQKRRGFRWPGVIVSRFHTSAGKARYVVECVVREVKGALHIYSASDLRRRIKS